MPSWLLEEAGQGGSEAAGQAVPPGAHNCISCPQVPCNRCTKEVEAGACPPAGKPHSAHLSGPAPWQVLASQPASGISHSPLRFSLPGNRLRRSTALC